MVWKAEVLKDLGMDVDVGDVEESSVPAKAGTMRASPNKTAPKSQSTPMAKPEPAPKSKPTPKATKLAEEVIELESSSTEGDAKVAERNLDPSRNPPPNLPNLKPAQS
jgi:hypothetical protein